MHLHCVAISCCFRKFLFQLNCAVQLITWLAASQFFPSVKHCARGGLTQGEQKSLHYCLSGAEKKSVSSDSGSSESDCNNKLCGIRLPPAFTANCLHSNEKRPRLSRILDDLPRARWRRDNRRRWLKVGPRRRPRMDFFFSPILCFPSAAAAAPLVLLTPLQYRAAAKTDWGKSALDSQM